MNRNGKYKKYINCFECGAKGHIKQDCPRNVRKRSSSPQKKSRDLVSKKWTPLVSDNKSSENIKSAKASVEDSTPSTTWTTLSPSSPGENDKNAEIKKPTAVKPAITESRKRSRTKSSDKDEDDTTRAKRLLQSLGNIPRISPSLINPETSNPDSAFLPTSPGKRITPDNLSKRKSEDDDSNLVMDVPEPIVEKSSQESLKINDAELPELPKTEKESPKSKLNRILSGKRKTPTDFAKVDKDPSFDEDPPSAEISTSKPKSKDSPSDSAKKIKQEKINKYFKEQEKKVKEKEQRSLPKNRNRSNTPLLEEGLPDKKKKKEPEKRRIPSEELAKAKALPISKEFKLFATKSKPPEEKKKSTTEAKGKYWLNFRVSKVKFTFLGAKRGPKGRRKSLTSNVTPASRQIPDDYDPESEDRLEDYNCWVCHTGGELICCDLCCRVWHPKCQKGDIPDGEWYRVCLKKSFSYP